MFYLIGLGLGDCKDVTVKGLEIIKKCSRVYLESYTSILSCGLQKLVSSSLYCLINDNILEGFVRKNSMGEN